jgi:hypothetical protein
MPRNVRAKRAGWLRVQPRRCDLCDRVAVWMHPAGGYRCNRCPRPEAT